MNKIKASEVFEIRQLVTDGLLMQLKWFGLISGISFLSILFFSYNNAHEGLLIHNYYECGWIFFFFFFLYTQIPFTSP